VGRWANKYVIGLTGNIGVGKSVVRQMLQHLGAYTIDADGLVHQAMAPGAPAYRPIVESFGQFILNPDKTINRAALGNIVFSNAEALAKLEAITHPIVGGAINTLISRAKQPVVIIEAIKLLEGDLVKGVDAVWVVDAKPQTQYTRLVTKRKMTEAEAKQRMLSQGSQAEKLKRANVVINNDGNVEETWKQVQAAWNKIPMAAAPSTPAAPAPTPKAPAAPAPQPAASAPAAQQSKPPAAQPQIRVASGDGGEVPIATVPGDVDASGITVRRGMPNNAEAIANFINQQTGKAFNRMDVMMSFGQKSYMIAHTSGDRIGGLVGFQVENLITRVDELYLDSAAPKAPVLFSLIRDIEEASKALQSEVGFFFLPANAGDDLLSPFTRSGYEVTTIKDIKIPAWREAVQEASSDNMIILKKQLRKDRVLKPI
jgi:dephospho-CoA kinase